MFKKMDRVTRNFRVSCVTCIAIGVVMFIGAGFLR